MHIKALAESSQVKSVLLPDESYKNKNFVCMAVSLSHYIPEFKLKIAWWFITRVHFVDSTLLYLVKACV